MGLQPTRLFTEWGWFFLALAMDVDAWAGRAGSGDGACSDGAEIYEWWPTRATGSCVGFVGFVVAPRDGDFEVLVYQGCLLVSVDESVCDGVCDNDDVCG